MKAQTRTVSADVFTPIGAYLTLSTPGASCLLESVESGGRISRYSFLGVDYLEARTFRDSSSLLQDVRAFVASHRIQACEAPPGGGALLAFSYDAARQAARLPRRESSLPAAPEAYVAIPRTWLVFDHYSDLLTIWTSGDDDDDLDARIDGYLARLLAAKTKLPSTVATSGSVSASIDCAEYLRLVQEVKRHIRDGDVYQLQLGIRFSAQLRGTAFDVYRSLRSLNPSPYMFFVDAPFGQVFGASPEFLVRLEGTRARIRPLAGTRSRGVNEAEDASIATELLRNEKERAEHVMLVDLGRSDLGSVCRYGSVVTEELLQIERYSHVMHIVSDLTGDLRPDRDALDLFAAGFPAGTVTGTPKIAAMQMIDRLEPVARGFYAGSIGRWSYEGDFDSCITLRSAAVRDGTIVWQASAGIVADSDPQSEYDEVMHKTRIMREALGL